jgi:integrase
MRIGECLRIKKSHIKFEKDSILISISGKIAKNGHGRITFVSEECKELLESRLSKIDIEDFVFTNGLDLEQNERTESQYIRRLCAKLDLDDYETDEKRKHRITIHKFRKYFSSVVTSNGMVQEYKNSFTGWDSFVATYHQFSVEELALEYKKIESSLFITQEFRQKTDLREKDLTIEKMKSQEQKITSLESALDQIKAHMMNISV